MYKQLLSDCNATCADKLEQMFADDAQILLMNVKSSSFDDVFHCRQDQWIVVVVFAALCVSVLLDVNTCMVF